MAKSKINVQGQAITMLEGREGVFFSLTDMARKFNTNPSGLIVDWLRNKETIAYLGVWEKLHNSKFKLGEFTKFSNQAGRNIFRPSVGEWIRKTGAIGIVTKQGRGGGTYAHKYIAFHFGMWLSPEFQLYLVKEFDRLKELELKRLNVNKDFSMNKVLNNLNESIHLLEDFHKPKKT